MNSPCRIVIIHFTFLHKVWSFSEVLGRFDQGDDSSCDDIDCGMDIVLIQASLQLQHQAERTSATELYQETVPGTSEGFEMDQTLQPGMIPSPTMLLENALPLAWLHVPKAGSSLGNTIIHTSGLSLNLPMNCVINSTTFCPDCDDFNGGMLGNFKSVYHPENAPTLFKWGNHQGVGTGFDEHYKGHGVMMIRQPEQRLISSWNHDLHDFVWGSDYPVPTTVLEYAQTVQGCTVRMLTRDGGDEVCGAMPVPTLNEMNEAKRRMDSFIFVGITDQWDLSVCLWRAMFGGPCSGSDFANSRVGVSNSSEYSTASLEGWTDEYDGPLYNHALELFDATLNQYHISESSCQFCFQQAESNWVPQVNGEPACQLYEPTAR